MPEVFSDIMLASRTKVKCDAIAARLPRPIMTARVDELVVLMQEFKPELRTV